MRYYKTLLIFSSGYLAALESISYIVSVTLWLNYTLYREWRAYDDSHKDESIATASALVAQWGSSDSKGEMYQVGTQSLSA